eukprot:gene13751-15189_t
MLECEQSTGLQQEDINDEVRPASPYVRPTSPTRGEGGQLNNKDCDETKETKDDLYFYTKSGDFTSEVFKICVENLPTFVKYQQLKQTLEKLKVKSRKIKLDHHGRCAYLTFRSEEEREEAIKTISGFSLKNHILTAKKAKPKPDPQLRKRQLKQDNSSLSPNSKNARLETSSDSSKICHDLPPEKMLVRVVTDLYDTPYDQQLKIKEDSVKTVLKRLTKDLKSVNAPILENYRNKVEFSIGKGAEDDGPIVGFRLGTYKDDNFAVVSPCECVNVSKEAKYIAKLFQDFIRKSSKDCYDAGRHTGCWRQLTVRSYSSSDVMVIVQIHPQAMTEPEIENLKSSVKDLFFADSNDVKVTSLYLQKCGQRRAGENISDTYEYVYGSKAIYEHMMDMKFRISPDAFFQVNTLAAEALYSKVREWCDISQDTTVLDICCGTGTIGLAIAKFGAKKMIGIELCKQAVDDARHNAEINNIANVEFICGKAEDFLYNVTKHLHYTDAVAVVDPPRAGLHKKVILALRQCAAIKRLIYVSCNPKQAATNFLDLCRPRTNRNKGAPFKLLKATPVDLFPHTKHCELALLMERIDAKHNEKNESLVKDLEGKDVDKNVTKHEETLTVKEESK